MTVAIFEHATVEAFETQRPITCEAQWLLNNDTVQECTNKADFTAEAHDEVLCCEQGINDNRRIAICRECKKAADILGLGECGHLLLINILPL